MVQRLRSYISYETEAHFVVAFLFCGAVILGVHVMLSQALMALLLMAGILAVCTLTIRYRW
jgi:hypothetical protein